MTLATTTRRSLLALAAIWPLSAAASAPLEKRQARDSATSGPDGEPQPASTTAQGLSAADMVGKRLRVLKPNMMMTMDYSEERINIEVDDQNKITRVFIG